MRDEPADLHHDALQKFGSAVASSRPPPQHTAATHPERAKPSRYSS